MVAEDDTGASASLKKIGLVVDIISKVLLGIASAIAGYYFHWETQRSEKEKQAFVRESECARAFSSTFEFLYGKYFIAGDISLIIPFRVPQTCPRANTKAERDELVRALSVVSSHASVVTSTLPGLPEPPAPPTPTITTQAASGWVAVGFLDSDSNFTLQNGDPITTIPNNNSVIKSKWQVNIRRAAADWRGIEGTLDASACFRVDETKSLYAGSRNQIWARGTIVNCS
jgi:hypothetical protein